MWILERVIESILTLDFVCVWGGEGKMKLIPLNTFDNMENMQFAGILGKLGKNLLTLVFTGEKGAD